MYYLYFAQKGTRDVNPSLKTQGVNYIMPTCPNPRCLKDLRFCTCDSDRRAAKRRKEVDLPQETKEERFDRLEEEVEIRSDY